MDNIQSEIDQYIKYQQENKKISDNDNYKLNFAYTDENEHIVDVYKNDKLLLRASYEILGCYNIICSMWIWGWSLSYVEKNLVKNTKTAAKNLYKILSNGDITKDTEEYLYYLSNPSFFISHKNLNKLLNFGVYMTESKFVLPHKIDENKPKIIEFILIKKITQEHNV